MAKYDRLLFILNLLRSRRNLNAAMIAAECGVTERTIYRDVISISEANVPIYYDRGYKYASDNFLPPLNFNIDEYLTLISILESSPLFKTGLDKKKIKSIKAKIEACLSQTVKKEKSFSSSPTSIQIKSTSIGKIKNRFYATIERGIQDNRVIKLSYNSIESGISEREIEPCFMIFIERAFYFIGYCYLRKEMRTFRVDRVKKVFLTNKSFKPRKNINPKAYFKDSWGVYGGDKVDVKVIMTGKAARIVQLGKHHPSEEIIVMDDNRIEYRVTVSGTDEICRWLLGFGGDITVVEPESLRIEVQKRAGKILKNYK
ncbi:MAG: transcriptional regulator [candidate division Zixibacteria bacterium]|nr:transcriptional regulator [candidate division Zixibacteria bacterium]